jgi:hypothetical protein
MAGSARQGRCARLQRVSPSRRRSQHLRVMVASPEYLLAMKCLAMRIGAEFHDEDDIRYLLRHLGVTSFAAAKEIITRYYPLERFPQKTMYALMEILE